MDSKVKNFNQSMDLNDSEDIEALFDFLSELEDMSHSSQYEDILFSVVASIKPLKKGALINKIKAQEDKENVKKYISNIYRRYLKKGRG